MAFSGLNITVSGRSTGAKSALGSLRSALASTKRAAGRTEDAVEELGDTTTRTTGSLSTLAGTAGATAVSLTGLSTAGTGASASLTALAVSTGTITTALVGLSAVAAPLAATLGTLAAAAGGLATAFGAVVGSGLLAFGEERAEQNEEQLEQVEARIEALEALEDETGALTEAQQEELETLEEEEDQLEDATSAVGALGLAFSDLAAEIQPLIVDFGEAFVPLIEDAFDAVPELVRSILEAIGGLEEFAAALRDAGQAAMDAIPAATRALVDLGREALPVLRDLTRRILDGAEPAFQAMIDVAGAISDELVGVGEAFLALIPNLTRVGTAILQRLLPALERGIRGLDDLLGAALKFAQSDQAVQLVDRIRAAIKQATPIIRDMVAEVRELAGEILDFATSQQATEIWNALRAQFQRLRPELEELRENAGRLIDVILENAPSIIRGTGAAFDSLLDIINALTPVVTGLVDALGDILQWYSDFTRASEQSEKRLAEDIKKIKQNFRGFKQFLLNDLNLSGAFSRLTSKITSAWSYLTGGLEEHSLVNDVASALASLQTFIRGGFGLADAFRTVANSITQTFNLGGVFDTVNDLIDDVEALINNLETVTNFDLDSFSPGDSGSGDIPPGNGTPNDPTDDRGGAVDDDDDDDDDSGGGGGPGSGGSPGITPGTGGGAPPVQNPGGRAPPGAPGIASGGFITRGGAAVIHEGERVVPAAQVSDRGDVELDTSELERKQQRTIDAVRDLADALNVEVRVENPGGRYDGI